MRQRKELERKTFDPRAVLLCHAVGRDVFIMTFDSLGTRGEDWVGELVSVLEIVR